MLAKKLPSIVIDSLEFHICSTILSSDQPPCPSTSIRLHSCPSMTQAVDGSKTCCRVFASVAIHCMCKLDLLCSDRRTVAYTGLSYYQSNQQDPNISKHGGEDDSEADDFEVHASDFVILAARNEDEVSHIEVCQTCFSTKHATFVSQLSMRGARSKSYMPELAYSQQAPPIKPFNFDRLCFS